MATGRMIARSLGRSKKYNQLPDHFTKLVYIHALTGADEQGRIEADAIAIYGDYFVVDPEASLDRIETALDEMHRVDLIQLYEIDGKRYAQFVDFEKHNTVRRDKNGDPAREARSRIPAPPNTCAETAQKLRRDRAETAPQDQDQGKDQDKDQTTFTRAHDTTPHAPPTENKEEEEKRPVSLMGFDEQEALLKLQQTDRQAHKILEIQGGQLGWKFRHKNLAAAHVLERRDEALTALTQAHKAANLTGASAYTYFERILDNPQPTHRTRPPGARPPERDYSQDISAGDLLDQATTLNGRWN